MITKHPWFGPKRYFGWGWTPISWEGWTVIAAWAVAFAAAHHFLGPTFYFVAVSAGLVAVLLVICRATGLPPG